MTASATYSNLYIKTPAGLIFFGTTDDQGRIVLTFPKRELLLGSNYEIGVDSFSIDTNTMYNIFSDQYAIVYKNSSNVETRKFLPDVKVATCVELLRQIDALNMGFTMDFSHPHAHAMDLKGGKLLLPVKLARALDIATVEYKVNPLVFRLNPDFTFTEEKVTINSVALDYIGIEAKLSTKFFYPMTYTKNIWNVVSTNSFQSLYLYSDLVVTEIISGVRVPFLGVFPFKELEAINAWRDIEPIWRRVDRERISECYIQVADSRGRLFKNVLMTIHVKIRKRDLK